MLLRPAIAKTCPVHFTAPVSYLLPLHRNFWNTNTGVKGHEKCIMELLPRLVDDVWPNITPTDHQICSGNMHRDSCYMHQSEVSGKTTWPVSCCMHATWFPPLCCTLISNVALGVTSSSHREIVRHS